MKRFEFKAVWVVEAETEEEAKEKFADDSMDFAADAECIELSD